MNILSNTNTQNCKSIKGQELNLFGIVNDVPIPLFVDEIVNDNDAQLCTDERINDVPLFNDERINDVPLFNDETVNDDKDAQLFTDKRINDVQSFNEKKINDREVRLLPSKVSDSDDAQKKSEAIPSINTRDSIKSERSQANYLCYPKIKMVNNNQQDQQFNKNFILGNESIISPLMLDEYCK